MKIIKTERHEVFDSSTNTFDFIEAQDVVIEHSLYTVSLYEMKYKVPFFTTIPVKGVNKDDLIKYVKCMDVNSVLDDRNITPELVMECVKYLGDPMTATTVRDEPSNKRRVSIMTNEVIYSSMAELGVPFECEHWHLNRLMTLLRVASARQQPPKKMTNSEILAQNRELNEQRKREMKTRG